MREQENQRDVELIFSHKDCILEGMQNKEDQEEIYYCREEEQQEIQRYLAPKAFSHAYRYTADGPVPAVELGERDNLLVKGDNLPAMTSLMARYEGAVKCIYIDPPYNTGNLKFGYQDSFQRSTWLTFMKNRLEVAKNLLAQDGFIFVQCDDCQNAYLKVLMDEIFGEENYRNSIYWHRTYAGKTVSKKLPWNTDTILLYSKSPKTALYRVTAELTEADKKAYTKDDGDGRGLYTTVSLQKTSSPGPETTYDYEDNEGRIWLCPKKGWRMKQSKLKALENDRRLYITDKTIREKYYLTERMAIGKQIDNFWNDIGNMNRANDLSYGLDGQKPEKLMQRIIAMATREGDLVLDFFMGTGTTCAAAMKMGRRFIGIEQLDYIEETAVQRLQAVMGGERRGISKATAWKGGGSFVYCRLAQQEGRYINLEEVEDAELSWEDVEFTRNFYGVEK